MKVKQLLSLCAGAALAASMPAQAEMFWSDNSLTLLKGSDYKVTDEEMTTMTVEHVSGHNWGDAFFFIDRHEGSDNDYAETYGELSPRFSFSNMTGKKLSAGPIKDVFAAFTYEFSSFTTGTGFASSFDNYLYGVGLDWNIPGFAFFQSQIFTASNDSTENDLQLTLVYGVPFKLGSVEMMVDGYIDWSSAEEDHASDFHFNPQITADISKLVGMEKSKLKTGIEYSYWNNKFGIKGQKEKAISWMVKYHL